MTEIREGDYVTINECSVFSSVGHYDGLSGYVSQIKNVTLDGDIVFVRLEDDDRIVETRRQFCEKT